MPLSGTPGRPTISDQPLDVPSIATVVAMLYRGHLGDAHVFFAFDDLVYSHRSLRNLNPKFYKIVSTLIKSKVIFFKKNHCFCEI